MRAVPTIALATCRALPEPDPDEAALLGALAREGALVALLPWDGGSPDPLQGLGAVDLVVVRSTWNYAQQLGAFHEWLDRVERVTTVCNPPAVLRRNVDKLYLRDLAAAGLPVVPTAFVERGSGASLAQVCETHGFAEVVVKPRVSAGSWKTARFAAAERAAGGAGAEFFRELVAERDVMVQPYVRSVEGRGERSIVVLDGVPSHAIRKSPRFSGDPESVTRVPIEPDERAFAQAALASYAGLLYARVDTARDDHGALMLMELELLEPSLFFNHAPEALPGFVAAILREARAAAARAR